MVTVFFVFVDDFTVGGRRGSLKHVEVLVLIIVFPGQGTALHDFGKFCQKKVSLVLLAVFRCNGRMLPANKFSSRNIFYSR